MHNNLEIAQNDVVCSVERLVAVVLTIREMIVIESSASLSRCCFFNTFPGNTHLAGNKRNWPFVCFQTKSIRCCSVPLHIFHTLENVGWFNYKRTANQITNTEPSRYILCVSQTNIVRVVVLEKLRMVFSKYTANQFRTVKQTTNLSKINSKSFSNC